MAELIDGKATSLRIQDEIAAEVEKIKSNGGKVPHLAAVLVGEDGASLTYVNAKVKACERIGFGSTLVHLPEDTTEQTLLAKVDELNNDDDIDVSVQWEEADPFEKKRTVDSSITRMDEDTGAQGEW